MRIALYCFDFGRTAITGAGIYYEQLGAILQQHGHEVDAFCMKYMMPDYSQSIPVYPWRQEKNLAGYDLIMCTPELVNKASKHGRPIVAILQRDVPPVFKTQHVKGIIYCAEHLQAKYPLRLPSMVWRPMCRLTPRNEPRVFKKVVGCVNLAASKGRAKVFELAQRFKTWEFICLHRNAGFSRVPENVTIWEFQNCTRFMQNFYDSVSLMYLPYTSEGYSTVALEACSQCVPVIGSDIPGLTEVCYIDLCNDLNTWNENKHRAAQFAAHIRWEEIVNLNDTTKLLNFIS